MFFEYTYIVVGFLLSSTVSSSLIHLFGMLDLYCVLSPTFLSLYHIGLQGVQASFDKAIEVGGRNYEAKLA